jgi:glycosyltransferase involved in cell wall biosynthesis
MLEAMAAGLPIIASRLPAHTTLITHRHTGWLTDSQEEFITGIHWLSQPEHNAFIATQAREWAQHHIGTWTDCAQRYITAYHHLLE